MKELHPALLPHKCPLGYPKSQKVLSAKDVIEYCGFRGVLSWSMLFILCFRIKMIPTSKPIWAGIFFFLSKTAEMILFKFRFISTDVGQSLSFETWLLKIDFMFMN